MAGRVPSPGGTSILVQTDQELCSLANATTVDLHSNTLNLEFMVKTGFSTGASTVSELFLQYSTGAYGRPSICNIHFTRGSFIPNRMLRESASPFIGRRYQLPWGELGFYKTV